jgi:hypothetical protein
MPVFCRTSAAGREYTWGEALDPNPETTPLSDPLDWLARRAAAHPYFLAHQLAAYQTPHNLTDADLARDFGCTAKALTMVRLCRATRRGDDGAEAAEDVRGVAGRFGCDPARLSAALGLRQGFLYSGSSGRQPA